MVSPSKGEVGHLSKTCTGGVPSPRAFFINVYRKYVVVMKPYDNQVTRNLDDVVERYYLGENVTPSVRVLIGGTTVQKELWTFYNDKVYNTVTICCSSETKRRKLSKTIRSAVDNKSHVVLWNTSLDSFLERKTRAHLFKLFPNYRMMAVMWEDNVEKLMALGYERPSLDEGFIDFTYHLT